MADATEPDSDEYDLFPAELETAGTETEDDIVDPSGIDFKDVVLAPSDWTVETILSQMRQSAFELDPDFQRRNAWTDQRKSKFIESLMLGLPIPQLVFAEEEDDHGDPRYVVIDGKQRLLAVEAFFSAENPLRLSGLTVLPGLNGKTLSDVEGDPTVSRYARRLSNRTIRTVVIRRWPHESFLHLVFHRINHQTLALSAQELRQALHPGSFTKFVDQFAGSSVQLHDIIGATQRPDFRMRDVELLVRFIAYKFRLEDYRGNLKKFLDDTCEEFNQEWSQRSQEFRDAAEACNSAIDVTTVVFGENAFRRWDEKWETRFNRAVFDIMCYYFSDPATAAAAAANPSAVVRAYVDLSTSDRRFTDSLATTTKTVFATGYRLRAWGEALGRALGVSLSTPRVSDDGRSLWRP